MQANKTFSRLTTLETHLLEALEQLLPFAESLSDSEKLNLESLRQEATRIKYTPDKKPFNLKLGQPVVYNDKSYIYYIEDGRHCLSERDLQRDTYYHNFNVEWKQVLTWQEYDIIKYKAYLKEHGIKKRVSKNMRSFDYTLHTTPKKIRKPKKPKVPKQKIFIKGKIPLSMVADYRRFYKAVETKYDVYYIDYKENDPNGATKRYRKRDMKLLGDNYMASMDLYSELAHSTYIKISRTMRRCYGEFIEELIEEVKEGNEI